MKKLFCIVLVLSLMLMVLSGCWDRNEINDLAFVVATGVDQGTDNTYRVSVQVPLPSSLGGSGSSGGGGGTSGEGPFLIAEGTGKNIREGIQDIQARLSRELYFAHRRVLVVGEELAKQGITKVLNAILIQPQSRLSTFLIVSKGEAAKTLQAQPKMEQFSAEAIREMAKTGTNQTVKTVLQDFERPGKEAIIPYIEATDLLKADKSNKEVAMNRFALFKGDKLAFITTPVESQGILWLLERMKRKSYSFPVAHNQDISVQIIDNQVKQSSRISAGKPQFTLRISATGTLLENEPNLRIEDPKTYHFIVGKMEQRIKKDVEEILDHAHSQKVDFYGLGWYLYKNKQQKWENDWEQTWENDLPEINVDVVVDADIQRATNSGQVEKE
ncbi:Ger(x)C family spore germination protein [Bacillus rubiinfantis]|uniref:Ger(x)C family spore germination protein n=1 Tax=Bacillus rubiinfantis TaxID=1499680 RepID=UPI0005A9D831|nr:Ger(x)C family spore germination protein [Bacillus rubiinfantis]